VPPTPPVALTIAGSDPSGGAGIQADLKTFSALEVYGATVVTALTIQDTTGVHAVHPVAPEVVAAQLAAVLSDLPVAATKTGALVDAEVIAAVAGELRSHDAGPLVVDPVLASTSGAALLQAEALEALRRELLPLAAVLTPNLPEAAQLLGTSAGEVLMAPEAACRALTELGPRAVLLKGGHAGGAHSEDLLWVDGALERLPARRIDTENTHGTGCVLSAALAAHLARGSSVPEAARAAKQLVTRALEGARTWHLGAGSGPLHPFAGKWTGDEA
jgi:hydroxymethylpyrimidine/phosphomethylpyrimidine kinase